MEMLSIQTVSGGEGGLANSRLRLDVCHRQYARRWSKGEHEHPAKTAQPTCTHLPHIPEFHVLSSLRQQSGPSRSATMTRMV